MLQTEITEVWLRATEVMSKGTEMLADSAFGMWYWDKRTLLADLSPTSLSTDIHYPKTNRGTQATGIFRLIFIFITIAVIIQEKP